MSHYAQISDLIARFGEQEIIQLTNRAGGSKVTDSVAERALTDADHVIDIYLGSRRSVTMTPAPAELNRIAADIARYYLYDDAAPDQIIRRYEEAIDILRAMHKNEVSLGTAEASPNTPQLAQTVGGTPVTFHRARNGGML